MMLNIQELPAEILEKIFMYLSKNDLITCTYVSYKWHEVVNTNKIWSSLLSKENSLDMTLVNSKQLFENPNNKYRECKVQPGSRIRNPCKWRGHFNRYMYLKNNWIRGIYTLRNSDIIVDHYKNGFFIERISEGLKIYNINDLKNSTIIKKEATIQTINTLLITEKFLFYSGGNRLVCLELKGSNFAKKYDILVAHKEKELHKYCHSDEEPTLKMCITDSYIAVQDTSSICFMKLYNNETGLLLKNIILHKYIDYHFPVTICFEASHDKLFVGISSTKNVTLVYDFKTDSSFVVETNYEIVQVVASKNFFSSKITETSDDFGCSLKVWSVYSGCEIGHFVSDIQFPFLITENDKLVHGERSGTFRATVYVRDLMEKTAIVRLKLDGRLRALSCVWRDFLIFDLETSIQMWDMYGRRFHTFRGFSSLENMWIDEQRIVLRLNDYANYWKNSVIIGFW